MNTTTETIQIDEPALLKADQITLSDLLQSDLIVGTVVRSLCIIRKELLSSDISEPEDQELESKITALFHAIGVKNRELAFDQHRKHKSSSPSGNGHAPTTGNGHSPAAAERPKPQLLPPPAPSAPRFTTTLATGYVVKVLAQLSKIGVRTIDNDHLRESVSALHLAGNQSWNPTDLIAEVSLDGRPLWHKTLQNAMEKLAADEAVMWSNKRSCWVVFDA
jgi:hypothetical protein